MRDSILNDQCLDPLCSRRCERRGGDECRSASTSPSVRQWQASGLTIPTIAVASYWLPVPPHLGLGATHIVLFALTCVVTVLTVVRGRATLLQAGVHFALLSAYLFLAISP